MKPGSNRVRRWVALLVVILIPLVACSKETESQEGGNAEMASPMEVREPAVAGAFYPGTEKALRDAVERMLGSAQPKEIDGRLVGLISPHAGYVYSGQVAAHAYKLIQGKQFDAVVVIAPSHHAYFEGSSIYARGSYRTPLGLIPIDEKLAEAIMNSESSIGFLPEVHRKEHALEVQLPFLQVAVPDLKLVPIVMGDQSLPSCQRLAKAIVSSIKGRNVLLVASTDLSHFHSYDEAVRLDQIIIDHVGRYDYEGLAADLKARKCEACGGGPVVTVMIAARQLGANKTAILRYANSGDVTGDRSNVVGYLAAAIVEAQEKVGTDLGLKHQEQIELLNIARQSIEAKVLGRPMPRFDTDSSLLRELRGAFVTITKQGQLRGCIGHIKGTEPLYSTVSKMAVAAATEDPRFPALGPGEIDEISVEISVLTPFTKISTPDEIKVGRDGLYIEKGPYRGLLLPQVATEYGWGRDQFLEQTCRKAGLPADGWREGADIFIFSAQVFNESELSGEPSSK
jgi:AmmeMemoRadiSam system protein B/AmmeMemoRadiSam system protein A